MRFFLVLLGGVWISAGTASAAPITVQMQFFSNNQQVGSGSFTYDTDPVQVFCGSGCGINGIDLLPVLDFTASIQGLSFSGSSNIFLTPSGNIFDQRTLVFKGGAPGGSLLQGWELGGANQFLLITSTFFSTTDINQNVTSGSVEYITPLPAAAWMMLAGLAGLYWRMRGERKLSTNADDPWLKAPPAIGGIKIPHK